MRIHTRIRSGIRSSDALRRSVLPAVGVAAAAALLAGILALSTALAPQTAAAQTTGGSVSIAVSSDHGDRNPNAAGWQVHEGDTITFTITADGATNAHPWPNLTLAADGAAWNSGDLTPTGAGRLSGFGSSLSVALSGETQSYSYSVTAGDGWAHGECRESVTLRIQSADDAWFAIDADAGAATAQIVPDTVAFCASSIVSKVWTAGEAIAPVDLPVGGGLDAGERAVNSLGFVSYTSDYNWDEGNVAYQISPHLPPGVTWGVLTPYRIQLRGTPTTAMAARSYTWQIKDRLGNVARLRFSITIGAADPADPAPPAPPDLAFRSAPADRVWTQHKPIARFNLPTASGGSGAISYALTPALPGGVTRDAASHRISGTPAAALAATDYTWTATDGNGDTASATFRLTVQEWPGPVFSGPLVARSWVQNSAIAAFTLPTATGGVGDLAYALSPDLPAGVTRNDATHQVSGTPTATLPRTMYTWTATDADGNQATRQFYATVSAAGSLVIVPGWTEARGQTTEAGGSVSFTVRLATEPLAYATVALASSDSSEGSVSPAQLILHESSANDVPINSGPWNDPITVTVTGVDDALVDGDVDYTVTATASCPDLVPTCGYAAASPVTLRLTNADDDSDSVAPAEPAANTAPVITAPDDKSYAQGATITAFAITVADAEDTPTVWVDGLPFGLSYNAAAAQVGGTVAARTAVGDYPVTITANDGVNPDVTASFTITVTATGVQPPSQPEPPAPDDPEPPGSDESEPPAPDDPGNSPPSIANPGGKSYTQGETITAFAITVTDIDAADTVTVSVSGLPSGLAYSSGTGQVSGTVAADATVQDYAVTIAADDGVNPEVTASFTISVAVEGGVTLPPGDGRLGPRRILTPDNTPPAIVNPGDKEYAPGTTIAAFDITVADVDAADTVTVSVSGLPSGLAYSAGTGQVSGTVAAGAAAQDYAVTITANDGVNSPVTDDFTVAVTESDVQSPNLPDDPAPDDPLPSNSPPAITNPGDRSYTQGETIAAFAIVVADADAADTVAVSVSGLPAGLVWSASAGEVSGAVAAAAAVRDYAVTITANDGVNPEVTDAFTVSVAAAGGVTQPQGEDTPEPPPVLTPPNSPPAIVNPGDRSYTQGEAIAVFAIVVADVDAADTVAVSVNGLPSGLAYSASAGQVGGVVAADAAVRDYAVVITANDGVNPDVTDTFTVTVAAGERTLVLPATPTPLLPPNSPPVITNPGNKRYAPGDVIHPFAIVVADDEDVPAVAVSGLPPGLLYSRITGQVSGTVAVTARLRDYLAVITANDGVNPVVRAAFTVRVMARNDDDDDDDDNSGNGDGNDSRDDDDGGDDAPASSPTATPAPTDTPTIRTPVWRADHSGGSGGAGLVMFRTVGIAVTPTPTPTPTPMSAAGAATPTPAGADGSGSAPQPTPVVAAAVLARPPSTPIYAPPPTPQTMADAPPPMPKLLPPSEPAGMDDGVLELALKWSWWLLLLLALLAVLVAVVYFSSREQRYYLD